MPEEPVFTMTCVVGRDDAIRRIAGGGVVTLSHPDPDVGAWATVRGIRLHDSPPFMYRYEVTLGFVDAEVTLNDEIMGLGLNGAMQLAEDHVFGP